VNVHRNLTIQATPHNKLDASKQYFVMLQHSWVFQHRKKLQLAHSSCLILFVPVAVALSSTDLTLDSAMRVPSGSSWNNAVNQLMFVVFSRGLRKITIRI
jgi:hypothetical protein